MNDDRTPSSPPPRSVGAQPFLWLRSFTGQFTAAAVAGLLVVQLVMLGLFALQNRYNISQWTTERALDRMVEVAERVAAADPGDYRRLVHGASSRGQRFALGPMPKRGPRRSSRQGSGPGAELEPGRRSERDARPEAPVYRDEALERTLADRLTAAGLAIESVQVSHRSLPPRRPKMPRPNGAPPPGRPDAPRGSQVSMAVTLALETSPTISSRWFRPPAPPLLPWPLIWASLATAFVLIVIAAFAARRITAPLRGLADAADRVGLHRHPAPLPETGPDDVRRTVKAFNRMEARLDRTLDHQRRMLAAVGHDLRSPMTALRLRTEFVQDEETRGRMARILDEMENITESILALGRETGRDEPLTPTDLGALISALAEDFRDQGADIDVATPQHPIIQVCRPLALSRALRNLIENALRYAGQARLSVSRTSEGIAILDVADDGPGIADKDLNDVFEAFVRGEASRNSETGGHGLGLTIARSLIEAQGGQLSLFNRSEGGLCARIALPLLAAEPGPPKPES